MSNNVPILFPITVFEMTEKVSETITKGRVRIFYKGINRNGGYISEEFAESLIDTIEYAPIKGIYDEENEDFTDHGKTRQEGRVYGVVPKDHNFAWETHLDKDGIEREYACVDVYLWTALYEEAKDILGAPQSMELYSPSITGEWVTIDNQRCFKYSSASFLGLQALGADTEPCFEGSAFFNLFTSMMNMVSEIRQFQKSQNNEGGKDNMDKELPEITFKLSDSQKNNKIFQALNTSEYRYYILDTYDEYAIVFDYETESFLRVEYTKDDSTDTVTVSDEKTTVFAEYVTAEEKKTLDTIRAIGGTYAAAAEKFENLQTIETAQAQKIEELGEEISTLKTEKDTAAAESANTISTLTAEVETLTEYKAGVEKAEKEAVFSKYEDHLGSDILEAYQARLEEFTVQELDKELAYELVSTNKDVFSKQPHFTPKDDVEPTGVEALLAKYRK